MKKLIVSGMALAGLLSLGAAQAQTVGQDMHDAGHDTAHASKTVAAKSALRRCGCLCRRLAQRLGTLG